MPKRKQSNPSEAGTETPGPKRTRLSRAVKGNDAGASGKPKTTTNLKIATRGGKTTAKATGKSTKAVGELTGKVGGKDRKSVVGEGAGERAEEGTDEVVVVAKKPRARKGQTTPLQEEKAGWGYEPPIYEEPVEEELDELSDDSEIGDIPTVPTTSLPISLRLRVSSPKPKLLIRAPAKPGVSVLSEGKNSTKKSGNLVHVSSESEFEIEPLPPKIKIPKGLDGSYASKKETMEPESNDDSDSDSDEFSVNLLKVAVEQDGATETFTISFAADYTVFRCHIASKLRQQLDEMQIAYRVTDAPKGDRHHLQDESHFEEMVGLALTWIDTKMDVSKILRDSGKVVRTHETLSTVSQTPNREHAGARA